MYVPRQSPTAERVEKRGIFVGDFLNVGFAAVRLSTLRAGDDPSAITALADMLAPHDDAQATSLYEKAAERGNSGAMSMLVARMLHAGNRAAAGKWADLLVATGDSRAMAAAADGLADNELAMRLLTPAADAGDTGALAQVVVRALRSRDEQVAEDAINRLVATGDWRAVKAAVDRLGDSDLAMRLLGPAANAGDTASMVRLVVRCDRLHDREGAELWADRILEARDWSAAIDAADGVGDGELALRLLLPAAEAWDAGAIERLWQTAAKLKETDPKRAEEVEARLPAQS
jgi:TPR repeat protein